MGYGDALRDEVHNDNITFANDSPGAGRTGGDR